jgi:hypothetical protein
MLVLMTTRPRGTAFVRGAALSLVDVGQHAHAALVELLAFGRELQLACGAVHQLDGQARFEPADELADGRGRHTERTGRGREALALDDLHEGFHLAGAVDVDARHGWPFVCELKSQVQFRPAF